MNISEPTGDPGMSYPIQPSAAAFRAILPCHAGYPRRAPIRLPPPLPTHTPLGYAASQSSATRVQGVAHTPAGEGSYFSTIGAFQSTLGNPFSTIGVGGWPVSAKQDLGAQGAPSRRIGPGRPASQSRYEPAKTDSIPPDPTDSRIPKSAKCEVRVQEDGYSACSKGRAPGLRPA
jgi:hypothetical protein